MNDPGTVSAVVAMPFLATPDTSDALAIRGIRRLAGDNGAISALTDHPIFQDGITDSETVLVAAAGTLYRAGADEIRRVLSLGTSAIEHRTAGTTLTPGLQVSIVRADSQSRPGTIESVRDIVEFVEGVMGLPLPTDHVILVLVDSAVSDKASGANYGFAISYLPAYEQLQGTQEWRQLQAGFVHEVAHYFWLGHEGWIDEGLANTVEYMKGRNSGLSRGQLKTRRGSCEAHDLAMLSEWNPPVGSTRYRCNYYLGQLLFQELLEAHGDVTFGEKLRELYLLSRMSRELGQVPGIVEVRQVFDGQADVVEKHWSGALNAPENRPFSEGVDRTSHDLVQWDQLPTYDGHSVTFSGSLLDSAVLSEETIEQARAHGYQNFTLYNADAYDFGGFILPPFTDGSSWNPGPRNSVASRYSLDAAAKSFTITFPFPEGLDTPSDYVVVVGGFQDDSRTPRIGTISDTLGYARIRSE